MNKHLIITAVASVALYGANTQATTVDITVNDNMSSTFFTGNGTGHGSANEINEVEANCIPSAQWDLRHFYFDAATGQLSINGGYNMMNGYGNYFSGDVFIDVNGDERYGNQGSLAVPAGVPGNGFSTVLNSGYGWDYAIVFDRKTGAAGGSELTGGYKVYQLTGASDLEVYYAQNSGSSPLRYLSGGTLTAYSGTIQQTDNSGDFTLDGLDLGWLSGSGASPLTFHFTMGCGNDLLIGQTSSFNVPDGGMTLVMLGMGLSAIGLVSRRTTRKT